MDRPPGGVANRYDAIQSGTEIVKPHHRTLEHLTKNGT